MIDRQIAVCSRTFSKHPQLTRELSTKFSRVRLNEAGEKLVGDSLVHFLKDCEGAIVALEKFDSNVIERLPSLRAIAKYGVGLDNLDQEALAKKNIALGWSGGLNRRSVAELALTFMIGLLRNVYGSGLDLRENNWQPQGGANLSGKTVGIIGCGFIGSDLAKLLQPFGCTLLINDIEDKASFCQEVGARQVDKEIIYREADVITLHVPLTNETRNLINAAVLERCKNSAIVVNTSRGNVVNEMDLLAGLQAKQIAGAAVDVFAEEPPLEHPLLKEKNFWATPHIGGSSAESILYMGRAAIENLVKVLG